MKRGRTKHATGAHAPLPTLPAKCPFCQRGWIFKLPATCRRCRTVVTRLGREYMYVQPVPNARVMPKPTGGSLLPPTLNVRHGLMP